MAKKNLVENCWSERVQFPTEIILNPSDFIRTPKDLREMNFWKASDFKVLLFYIMPLSFGSLCRDEKTTRQFSSVMSSNLTSVPDISKSLGHPND